MQYHVITSECNNGLQTSEAAKDPINYFMPKTTSYGPRNLKKTNPVGFTIQKNKLRKNERSEQIITNERC